MAKSVQALMAVMREMTGIGVWNLSWRTASMNEVTISQIRVEKYILYTDTVHVRIK